MDTTASTADVQMTVLVTNLRVILMADLIALGKTVAYVLPPKASQE